jgi:mannose/fructose-specific phosphotransferase system component IIA
MSPADSAGPAGPAVPGTAAPVPALIVTHGRLGEALIGAAGAITGPLSGVEAMSNEGLSRDALVAAVAARVAVFGPRGGLVFADVLGGSCAQAALAAAARGAPGPVRVLCGVNLAMLLDFVHNRARLEPAALADHVLARGRAAVQLLEMPVAEPEGSA